ncbi:MAG: phospholipase D family protein [Candidatus Parvarchaeum sp.]
MGYGISTYSSIISQLIREAEKNIIMTVYLLNDRKVLADVNAAVKRGVLIEVFIYLPDDTMQNRHLYIELETLAKKYQNLKIHAVRNKILHAKILVSDYSKTVVGSANFTFSGTIKNYELGILIEDKNIAQTVASLIKRV